MHAVTVQVTIDPGSEADGMAYLESNVLPAMKQIPGLVAGYWLAAKDGEGLTVLIFENEQAATSVAAGLPNAPRAEAATIGAVDVREIVAHI